MTPGNKTAAVVAGLNVIVFTIITYLGHREKVQKKLERLQVAPASSISSAPSIENEKGKNLSLGVHTVEIRDDKELSG